MSLFRNVNIKWLTPLPRDPFPKTPQAWAQAQKQVQRQAA